MVFGPRIQQGGVMLQSSPESKIRNCPKIRREQTHPYDSALRPRERRCSQEFSIPPWEKRKKSRDEAPPSCMRIRYRGADPRIRGRCQALVAIRFSFLILRPLYVVPR
jgi:hypothetical protein